MVAPHHLLLILLPFFASFCLASDSINDFSDDNAAEEGGIEPSRFQKFIAKFEQEQQMKLEAELEQEMEDQIVGESSPKVARQVPDESLPQVF